MHFGKISFCEKGQFIVFLNLVVSNTWIIYYSQSKKQQAKYSNDVMMRTNIIGCFCTWKWQKIKEFLLRNAPISVAGAINHIYYAREAVTIFHKRHGILTKWDTLAGQENPAGRNILTGRDIAKNVLMCTTAIELCSLFILATNERDYVSSTSVWNEQLNNMWANKLLPTLWCILG